MAQDRDDQTAGDGETSPVLEFVAYRISRVHNRLNAQTARILNDLSEITVVRWRIVAVIGAVGSIRMSEIAQMSAFDKGMLSRNLKELVNDGIVHARTEATDRRTQVLRLTRKGQMIYDRTIPALIARNAQLVRDIPEDDMAVFIRVLEKLDAAAAEAPPGS